MARCCLVLLLLPVLCCVLGACAIVYVYTNSPEPPVTSDFRPSQQEANLFNQAISTSAIQAQYGLVTFNERELSSWVALRGQSYYEEQHSSYPFKNVQVGLDKGKFTFYAEYKRYGLNLPLVAEVKPVIDPQGNLSLDITSASIASIHAPKLVLNRATTKLQDLLNEPFAELNQRISLNPNTLQIQNGQFSIQGTLR